MNDGREAVEFGLIRVNGRVGREEEVAGSRE
jgi:hypothetical protein